MATMNGWAGKILKVDLSEHKIESEVLPRDWAEKYVGGSGFGARVLYDEVGPDIDPLDPKAVIIIGQGPLSGTLAPASGRYELVAKSPLTGIYARSNGGGNFGPEMKWAGYDLIIICGKSENPVYLWIEDDHVELRDASHLWGHTTWETRQMICQELGDPDVATLLIGPAGENLCFSSCVISDLSRAAGKCSIGAIWGSKNLKGVACRGSKGVTVAKPKDLLLLSNSLRKRFKEDPLYETHTRYGTTGWVGGAYARSPLVRMLFAKGSEAIEEKAFAPLYKKKLACFGCPLHCSNFYDVKKGKYKGTKGEGIEGNLQLWVGIGCRGFDAAFLCRVNNLCNQLGVNLDSLGAAINWAMTLYEAGIITKADTDGLEVTWGNEDVMLELLRKMAYKEGFGELLDTHPVRAAQRLGRGSEKYATHTKGLYAGMAGTGIGTSLAYTLALNVATRGFDHLVGGPTIYSLGMREEWGITREYLSKLGQERYNDPNSLTEPWSADAVKAQVVYEFENLCAICDMTGVCKFASWWALSLTGLGMADFSKLLSVTTGLNFAEEDLVRAAEREFMLERAYNAREGIRRVHDYPFSLRWQLEHGEPHPIYDHRMLPVKFEDYDMVLDEYYSLRGCDLKTGIPTRAKLEKLGLKDVADDMEKRKILPD